MAELPANYHENVDSARRYKEIGNKRYKNGEFGAAIGQYHRAVIYLKAIDAAQKYPLSIDQVILPADKRVEVDQLFADCQSNLAACLLQSDKPSYTRVVDCCKEATTRVPTNIKAHYRLGVALYHLKRFAEANDALKKAAELQTKPDASVKKYLDMCQKAIVDEKQRERDRCKAMFSAAGDDVIKTSNNGVKS